jgi:hypothetical protein
MTSPANAWLVLVYQLPAKRSPVRVKAWRRLQRVGAVTLKNSAYVLPNRGDAREDFEWIKTEIVATGGQAMVLTADALDAATGQQLVELFRTARGLDFEAIRRPAQALLDRWRPRTARGAARRRLIQTVRRLRERFRELEGIDFFDAPQRTEAARILDELDRTAKRGHTMVTRKAPAAAAVQALDSNDYRGRVWLTRTRPGVDRMSSAWLIRRFIDPGATFAFGDAPDAAAMIPFDMFGAEFGHHGDACTFETIAQRFAIDDPAVTWIGHVVHDLDLKESTYRIAEGDAVGRMVEGLRRMYPEDQTLLREGITMFEALYRSHTGQAPAASKPRRSATSPRGRRRKPRT